MVNCSLAKHRLMNFLLGTPMTRRKIGREPNADEDEETVFLISLIRRRIEADAIRTRKLIRNQVFEKRKGARTTQRSSHEYSLE